MAKKKQEVDVHEIKLPVGKSREIEKAVNHPNHYGGDTIYETIKVLKAWMTPEQFEGFCLGNTIKYISRAGKKDAKLQELKKAKFYLDYQTKEMEAEVEET